MAPCDQPPYFWCSSLSVFVGWSQTSLNRTSCPIQLRQFRERNCWLFPGRVLRPCDQPPYFWCSSLSVFVGWSQTSAGP
jgi:hypothetical protein